MKKILILLLVLATNKMYSQVDTSTYSKKVDYLFQNVNQAKFAGSVLYDRAIPIVDLQYCGQKSITLPCITIGNKHITSYK